MSKHTISALIMIALTGCFAPPPIGGEGDLVDADGDGFTADADCNDDNTAIHPGVNEVCNGLDDNCDGVIDPVGTCPTGDSVACYGDGDFDGSFGGVPTVVAGSSCPVGLSPTPTDCNDASWAIKPGATEQCNGLDDDCDGSVDEGVADRAWYRDADGDTFGTALDSRAGCSAPAGYVDDNTDCDDSSAQARPNRSDEDCGDGVDNNCDGFEDEDDALCPDGAMTRWYFDGDADGYGDIETYQDSVTQPYPANRWLPIDSDCDDARGDVHPNADEICEPAGTLQVDNDCDGIVNDGCSSTPVCTPTGTEICGNSVDEDCVGGANACPVCVPTGVEICGNGVDEDCNASTTDVCTPTCVPTGPEVCGNGVNEDCNASTSDTCPVTPTKACYEDRDNDGYGANGRVTQRATCLSTESEEAGDCEDGDALRFPELMEVQDLRDNDCDGMTDEDGLVTFRRYYRTPGVDWDHLFATSTPAGGYSQDDKWMKIYPVNICSGTYRPFDTCVVNGNGATVTLHGGNQLEALSQCRGLIGEDDITLLLLEGSGEYRDYSVRSGFSCSRLGYAMSQTGSARQSFGTLAKLLWRHRSSPFVDFGVGGRPGVADNMWSTLPLEGEVGHGGTSTDLDYDEHTAAFYVPYAR